MDVLDATDPRAERLRGPVTILARQPRARIRYMPIKNPEARRAYAQRWRDANRDKVAIHNRRAALKRKYGITSEQYDALVEAQGGRCGICPATEPGGGGLYGFWLVDHDHETGRVRGLLCSRCNIGLGMFGDNEAGLLKALAYLRNHSTP